MDRWRRGDALLRSGGLRRRPQTRSAQMRVPALWRRSFPLTVGSKDRRSRGLRYGRPPRAGLGSARLDPEERHPPPLPGSAARQAHLCDHPPCNRCAAQKLKASRDREARPCAARRWRHLTPPRAANVGLAPPARRSGHGRPLRVSRGAAAPTCDDPSPRAKERSGRMEGSPRAAAAPPPGLLLRDRSSRARSPRRAALRWRYREAASCRHPRPQ